MKSFEVNNTSRLERRQTEKSKLSGCVKSGRDRLSFEQYNLELEGS